MHHDSPCGLLVLVRCFPLGQKLAYVPFAPEGCMTGVDMEVLSQAILSLLPHGVFVLRYDLPWGTPGLQEDFRISRLRSCKESVQPVATVRISLHKGMSAVYQGFRQRCRRNLKKAVDNGITIRHWEKNATVLSQWYELYLGTARRDGFSPRPLPYIKDVLEVEESDGQADLYVAYDANGDLAGGIIVLFGRQEAVYLHGSSRRDVFSMGASWLLQVHAMEKACEVGCKVYDLHGISASHDGRGHLGRLDLFKTSFGGEIIDRPASLDFIRGRLRRRAYVMLENLRYSVRRGTV